MTKLSTDGLILKEQRVGEADRLCTVLTRDGGLVKAFASGALNMKSKNHAGTQLLCYSSLVLSKGRDTYRITESQPKELFFELRSDLGKLSLAQYFCELCAFLAPEEEAEGYLRLMLNSLSLLEKGESNISIIKAVTELKLMCYSGYMPRLDECDVCSCAPSGECCFDPISATVRCLSHSSRAGSVAIGAGVLSAMRFIVSAPLEKVYFFNLGERSLKILCAVSEKYIAAQTERGFKTLDFYNRVKAM